MRKSIHGTAVAWAAIACLAGCTVGPNYKRPAYPTPPALRGADNAQVTGNATSGASNNAANSSTPDAQKSLGDEQWAEVFREPELQELIRTALTNNYDIRIAAQRVLEQQAQVKITRSQEFPTLSIGGTAIGAT